MHTLSLLTVVLGLTLAVGACRNPDYKADPSAEACNMGGPLGAKQLLYAKAPNPQAVSGRPVDCKVGSDGVMRLSPSAAR
jgi:hypothetical protein